MNIKKIIHCTNFNYKLELEDYNNMYSYYINCIPPNRLKIFCKVYRNYKFVGNINRRKKYFLPTMKLPF